MVRISTGSFSLSLDGQTVPVEGANFPEMEASFVSPIGLKPMQVSFRARLLLDDPVDRQIAAYELAERVAEREMSPNELDEAKTAAVWSVIRDRLLSSVRLPRPATGRLI